MTLVIYVELLILALMSPKSKAVTWLVMTFMFFMFSFVYYEGDLQIYEWVYNDFYTGQFFTAFEPAFTLVIWICTVIGLPFSAFRAVLAIAYLALTYKATRQQTEYTAIAMALMTIFPLVVYTSVLRSGIASAILLYAMTFLTENGKKNNFKYFISVIMATLFHYSAVVFFVFMLARRKISIKKMLLYSMFAFGLLTLLYYTDIIYRLVSFITSNKKILQWFVKGNAEANLKGTISAFMVLAVNCILAMKAKEICHSPKGQLLLSMRMIRFSYISYNVAVLMILFLPLMIFATPFMRLPYMVYGMVISTCVNATMVVCMRINHGRQKKLNPKIAAIGIGIFVMTMVWRFYYCLPYLKQGMVFFGEFLNTKVIF